MSLSIFGGRRALSVKRFAFSVAELAAGPADSPGLQELCARLPCNGMQTVIMDAQIDVTESIKIPTGRLSAAEMGAGNSDLTHCSSCKKLCLFCSSSKFIF